MEDSPVSQFSISKLKYLRNQMQMVWYKPLQLQFKSLNQLWANPVQSQLHLIKIEIVVIEASTQANCWCGWANSTSPEESRRTLSTWIAGMSHSWISILIPKTRSTASKEPSFTVNTTRPRTCTTSPSCGWIGWSASRPTSSGSACRLRPSIRWMASTRLLQVNISIKRKTR